MEKADLNVRLTQVKTDLMEKELQLGNEIQRLKNEVHSKESQLVRLAEELKAEMLDAVIKVQVSFNDVLGFISMEFVFLIGFYCMQTDTNSKVEEYEHKIKELKEQIIMLKSNTDYMRETQSNKKEVESVQQAIPSTRSVIGATFDPIDTAKDVHFRKTSPSVSQPIPIDASSVNYEQMRMIPRGEGEVS